MPLHRQEAGCGDLYPLAEAACYIRHERISRRRVALTHLERRHQLRSGVDSAECLNAANDVAQAQRATTAGPVFVTDRGKPTFALLKIEAYYKLTGEKPRSPLDIMDSLPCTANATSACGDNTRFNV